MLNFCKHISCLFLFSALFAAHGQELPTLGTAPEIQRGSLPDGIQYYLVTNPERKGLADFALVQRGRGADAPARELLRELPHFGARAPYRFLSDHGIGYGEEGYVSLPADAAQFTFRDVPTWDASVADSTLLMLFDIAAASRKPQAIVICGDIDAARLRERMGLLSMMVPELEKESPGDSYAWAPKDSLSLLVSRRPAGNAAAINAIFSAERLPREVMNTPQPLVSKAYAEQLGRIAGRRVERAFRAAGIPLADFQYRYQDSAQVPADELHILTVGTSAGQVEAATRLFASVLAALDRDGASPEEFTEARERQVADARRNGARHLTNPEYMERCVASYLYGADLASGEMLSAFIGTRRLDDERERELFNGFAQALLDSARNLTLRFDLPNRRTPASRLHQAFLQGWQDAPVETEPAVSGLPALHYPARKLRLSADTAEPLTGGRLWTFSNGMKVIYKKMGSDREFRYALLLRGGVAEVEGLRAGESAFVGDMLALSTVAGMRCDEFRERLDASGITMQAAATLSDLRISGRAPAGQFPLLIQTLLALSGDRQPDPAAFAAYKAAEALRVDREALSPRDVDFLMDSILRPNYFYPERKRPDCLGDDLPQRADRYFSSLFDKAGDGVLVLVGDLEEEPLKKELCRTLGAFRTQKRFSSRPRVESRLATGSVTRTDEAAPGTVGGREISANVALSAPVPFTLDHDLAFRVAARLVRDRLASALADQGAYAELSERLELFPAERLTLYIHARPCPESGLPAGMVPGEPSALLDAIRSVTRRLDGLAPSNAWLNACKAQLLKEFDLRRSDPQALLEEVLTRYGEGKDLVTDYKAAVQRVSVESVQQVLGLLQDGAEVEYLIN